MAGRRLAAVLGLAAAGTLATAGLAFAATGTGGPSEVLDELVSDGTITQEQADRVAEAFEEHREQRMAEREERRAEFEQLVADTVGLSAEEVQERLQAGETLGEIAGDQRDALADAMVAQRSAHIDEKLAEGRISEEQAEEMKAALPEHVEAMLDGQGPRGGPGGPGHRHGPGGPFGPPEDVESSDGEASDATDASAAAQAGAVQIMVA